MGFVPIAGEEFVFEASLSLLFHPNAGGVPTLSPELVGERIALKIPDQFAWIRKHEGPIDHSVGQRLAEWAKGSPEPKKGASTPEKGPGVDVFDPDAFLAEVEATASNADDAKLFETWWNSASITAKRKKLALVDQEKSTRARGIVADRLGVLMAGSEV